MCGRLFMASRPHQETSKTEGMVILMEYVKVELHVQSTEEAFKDSQERL